MAKKDSVEVTGKQKETLAVFEAFEGIRHSHGPIASPLYVSSSPTFQVFLESFMAAPALLTVLL